MNLIIQHYFMKQHFLSYLIALLLFPLYEMQAAYQPEFSTAGFYELANSGREVYSMNPAWRFHKGTATGAETTDFNDQDWKVVSLPDGALNMYRLRPVDVSTIKVRYGTANISLRQMN